METAFLPIFAKMPQPREDELLDALDAAQQIYASVGITTCQEGATNAADLASCARARSRAASISTSSRCRWSSKSPSSSRNIFPTSRADRRKCPRRRARIRKLSRPAQAAGVKFVLDGSPQGKTAFWTKPLLTPAPPARKTGAARPLFPPELGEQGGRPSCTGRTYRSSATATATRRST